MKNRSYRFDTAILFTDFYRFPLSIDKNHLIATDFYRYRFYRLSTPALNVWRLKTPSFDGEKITLRRYRLSKNVSYNKEIEMMLRNFDGATRDKLRKPRW